MCVVIDIRKLNSVKVDAKSRTVIAESGANLGDFSKATLGKDMFMVHGDCKQVGLGGHLLGGGIGLGVRNYGMSMDHIVNMTMMTYKSDIVFIDRKTNKDLFFALRGAGSG